MRPRWRKVFSDLWTYRARSLLVIASIATGLFTLGTIATIHHVVQDDMRVGYASANPANIRITTSFFDQRMVEKINRLPGVRHAEGAREFTLRLQSAPGEWISFNMRAVSDWEKDTLNQIHTIDGSWPPKERELAIERYKLPETNARLGEPVTLEMPGGQIRALDFTGIVSEQTLGSFEIGPGFFLAPAQGYVSEDTLEWLGQPRAGLFDTLYVSVEENSENEAYLIEFADSLAEELEKAEVTPYSIAVRGTYDHPNRIFTDAIEALLILLGFMVVFLSGFLITNTMQALVAQQVSQIGIMKTVGARRRQIAAIYFIQIFFFSLVSIAIAVPLAYEVAFGATAELANRINFIFQGKRLIPSVIILQIGVGVIIPQLAGFFPIWRGAQLSIQEALSGIRQDQLLYQDRLSRWLTHLSGFSRPTLVALRNTIRRKGRLLLTLVTLSLGGAVFIGTFNVRNSMSNFVVQVSHYFLGDINLALEHPYRFEKIDQILSKIPEIEYYEPWGRAIAQIFKEGLLIGESIYLLAPPSDSQLVQPIMLQGRWLEPDDQNAIVLNEGFLARYPDIKIGDALRLRVNGRETDWRVVGFFQFAGKRTSLIAYAGYDYLSKLVGAPEQASVYRIVAKQSNLSEEEQKAFGRDIEALMKHAGIEVSEVTSGSWISSTSAEGFSVLTAFLLFLSILTALVGSIGLAGTMSMNVFERTREIGIMRAIGASNPILMRMILTEGVLVGLLSWALAVPLSWPISRLLYRSVSMALFGVETKLDPTPMGYVFWLGFVVLLSLSASYLPARKAASLTIREVLSYE